MVLESFHHLVRQVIVQTLSLALTVLGGVLHLSRENLFLETLNELNDIIINKVSVKFLYATYKAWFTELDAMKEAKVRLKLRLQQGPIFNDQ